MPFEKDLQHLDDNNKIGKLVHSIFGPEYLQP